MEIKKELLKKELKKTVTRLLQIQQEQKELKKEIQDKLEYIKTIKSLLELYTL